MNFFRHQILIIDYFNVSQTQKNEEFCLLHTQIKVVLRNRI